MPAIAVGEQVLVTGCGLSETRDGGYAEFARVPAEAVVKLPASLGLREAMAVGTAGFAAALAITQLEHNGLAAGQGPVAVTGATGGVGLHRHRHARGPRLRSGGLHAQGRQRGVAEARRRERSAAAGWQRAVHRARWRPERWAGAIDNVGGRLLSWLLRSTRMQGSVAAVGLAGGAELNVSVMPFILRGVNLLGINSAATRRDRRLAVWNRIAADLAPRHLDDIVTRTVALAGLTQAFESILAGTNTGRTLVRIHDEH